MGGWIAGVDVIVHDNDVIHRIQLSYSIVNRQFTLPTK